ncbi:NAD(P)-binding domain-containing protein [Actinomadura sp. 6N118]|uniref:NAD(P)-binding domain-containing protein n=1 Tax=Actinomadura sp. 6N118 TaxID=3375151 RepID=UPI0037BDBF8B
MARVIATRAVAGGNSVEIIGRDAPKDKGLAAALGGGATAGTFGTVPAGDVAVLAVPYTSAVPVVAQYEDALAGKVIIDISNTFNADTTGLVIPDGTSGAQGDRQGRRSIFFKHVLSLARPAGGGRPLAPADRRGLRAGEGGGDRIHRIHRVQRGGRGTAGR